MSHPQLEAINSLRNLLHRESQQDNLLYGRGALGRRAAPAKQDNDAKVGCRLEWGQIFTTRYGSSQRVNLKLNTDAEDPVLKKLANQNPDFVWSWADTQLKSVRSRKELWKDFDALFAQLKTNLESSAQDGDESTESDDPFAPKPTPAPKNGSKDKEQPKQGNTPASDTNKQPAAEKPAAPGTKSTTPETKPTTVAADAPAEGEISKPKIETQVVAGNGENADAKADRGNASGLEDFHDAHENIPPPSVPNTQDQPDTSEKPSVKDPAGPKDRPQAGDAQQTKDIDQTASTAPVKRATETEASNANSGKNAISAAGVPLAANSQYVDVSTQTEEAISDQQGSQPKSRPSAKAAGVSASKDLGADDFPDLANSSDSDPFAPKENFRPTKRPNPSNTKGLSANALPRRTKRADTSDDDPFAPKSVSRPKMPVARSNKAPVTPASFPKRQNLEESSDDDPFAPKGSRKSKSLGGRNVSGR